MTFRILDEFMDFGDFEHLQSSQGSLVSMLNTWGVATLKVLTDAAQASQGCPL